MQSYAIKTGIEANRRNKPLNMGSLFWQLNDVWPVISWSSVDFYGEWKALHYTARNLYRNLLISIYSDPNSVDKSINVYLVSDYLDDIFGTLRISIDDFKNTKHYSNELNVKVAGGKSIIAFTVTKEIV